MNEKFVVNKKLAPLKVTHDVNFMAFVCDQLGVSVHTLHIFDGSSL